eukprot:CAMPEP_0113234960 /NCGR_PEP_ID=MMETSP0008_2-20120614/3307_1 /TAXON_ID=97485 /ORGANISM="Prymnesium parvum" /LENGTH=61 /DNA_ID=CAMNT_0000081867 /DNA_START=404 /DNA_END=586 /DNA_ORIENTATION=+ /assembly_acc=CAM_ASM_000153
MNQIRAYHHGIRALRLILWRQAVLPVELHDPRHRLEPVAPHVGLQLAQQPLAAEVGATLAE